MGFELPMYDPLVFSGVIDKTATPDANLLGNKMIGAPRNVRNDIIRFNTYKEPSDVARNSVKGSEAHLVGLLGFGQMMFQFLYSREKKIVDANTEDWIRQWETFAPNGGAVAQEAMMNAQAYLTREGTHLTNRMYRKKEIQIWDMLFKGKVVVDEPDCKANVDYHVPSTHKRIITGAGTDTKQWDNTDMTPREDIRIANEYAIRDSGTTIKTAHINSWTLEFLLTFLEKNGKDVLSDRQKESLLTTNMIPNLYGLNWHVYDLTWTDSTNTTFTKFIPDGYVLFSDLTTRNPIYMAHGPSIDPRANGKIGNFFKTYIQEDPPSRIVVGELVYLMVNERPEQTFITNVLAHGTYSNVPDPTVFWA